MKPEPGNGDEERGAEEQRFRRQPRRINAAIAQFAKPQPVGQELHQGRQQKKHRRRGHDQEQAETQAHG
jgi:hypothetical protein